VNKQQTTGPIAESAGRARSTARCRYYCTAASFIISRKYYNIGAMVSTRQRVFRWPDDDEDTCRATIQREGKEKRYDGKKGRSFSRRVSITSPVYGIVLRQRTVSPLPFIVWTPQQWYSTVSRTRGSVYGFYCHFKASYVFAIFALKNTRPAFSRPTIVEKTTACAAGRTN